MIWRVCFGQLLLVDIFGGLGPCPSSLLISWRAFAIHGGNSCWLVTCLELGLCCASLLVDALEDFARCLGGIAIFGGDICWLMLWRLCSTRVWHLEAKSMMC